MRTRIRRWSAVAGVATLTVLVSGCQTPGLVGFPDGVMTMCAARDPGEEVAFGTVFSIPPTGHVVIEQVETKDTGVEIIDVVAVPPAVDGSLLGSADMPLDPDLWAQRTELEGAEYDGEQTVNVIIIASRTGEADGTISDLRIAYTLDGQLFADTSSATFEIRDACEG